MPDGVLSLEEREEISAGLIAHSPWQRGQIENQNRQWRWWFPRGTDLAGLNLTHVDNVATILNNQRRRNLDNQRPADIYHALTVR
jgi:transposase, IS30 family